MALRLATPEETRRLGERLGRALRAGDVVGLVGPLGAGKTTLAQGLAVGLGVPAERRVASPSFALVHEHPGRVPFVHADLYRVAHPAELAELGLEEAYDRAACAIEWLDRFPQLAPRDRIDLILDLAPEGRLLHARATGPRGAELARALAGG